MNKRLPPEEKITVEENDKRTEILERKARD